MTTTLEHGHARRHQRSPEYRSWVAMKSRCTNPKADAFPYYGGRGIRVCAEWCGPGGFARFLAAVGPRPPGTTLDREDTNGDYEPGNCRWATRSAQMRNTRRAIRVTLNGELVPLKTACTASGVPYRTAWLRLRAGWTPEDAATVPVRRRRA